eukprot:679638-Pelagomonas_calceolata.AAC.1
MGPTTRLSDRPCPASVHELGNVPSLEGMVKIDQGGWSCVYLDQEVLGFAYPSCKHCNASMTVDIEN